MPKPVCTQRAAWRLLAGKPAQHLSAYYKLDCEFGTSLVAIFKAGESTDPLYLCESHLSQVQSPRLKNATALPSALPDQAPIASEAAVLPRSSEFSAHAGAPEPPLLGRVESVVKFSPKPSVGPAPMSLPAITVTKARPKTESSGRAVTRDLTYGDGAKALVDESIWNLPTGDYAAYNQALAFGKSAADAAQAAGGQLAIVHRKISEYTFKIEAVLSESIAKIALADAIDAAFESAIVEVIGDGAMSDAEKDSVIEQLGTIQEWINHGLGREITPLQAHRILRAIGDRANWGSASAIPEQLKPAYRTVFSRLRDAIRVAAPHTSTLHERLANLYAAKCDLEIPLSAKPAAAVQASQPSPTSQATSVSDRITLAS